MESEILEQIMRLARIELDDTARNRLTGELVAILGHFQKLQQLDTAGVEPSSTPVELEGRLRQDTPLEEPPERSLMSNTSHHQDRFFRVPRVIE